MIQITFGNTFNNSWLIFLPHEINNEFLGNAGRAARAGKINGVYDIPSFNDFGANVEFSLDKLDKLYNDFTILENHLDEITKIVPLPKQIGRFDGYYYEGFVENRSNDIEEMKKWCKSYSSRDYGPQLKEHERIYREGNRNFTKEDMLLIISLIKKKILEAKEKGETLVFSGD